MSNQNKFPETEEKQYLRELHLKTLSDYRARIGQDLHYFGLPSAEMRDVALWRALLARVVAVEQDADLIYPLIRTATRLDIYSRLILFERPLLDVAKVLAMDENIAQLASESFSPSEQAKIRKARESGFDVINFDPYGGFLYESSKQDTGRTYSKNVEVFEALIRFQSRHSKSFFLIITLELRDQGKAYYIDDINTTLSQLEGLGIKVDKTRQWYTSTEGKAPPATLRFYKFCVPTYLHRMAYQDFQVLSMGAWRYGNYFHTILFFERRQNTNLLGLSPYPPIDELKTLINRPVEHIKAGSLSQIQSSLIQSPTLD